MLHLLACNGKVKQTGHVELSSAHAPFLYRWGAYETIGIWRSALADVHVCT